MRAVSLFGVLLVAHLLMLAEHGVPLSPWTPFAFFWQDLLVSLLFAGVDSLLQRPRLAWGFYAVLVLYTAINVPIAYVLSSPLTWPMVQAAGGPLRDSIGHYLTGANLGSMMIVLLTAVALPVVLNRVRLKVRLPQVVVLILVTVIGAFAATRMDTEGRHRNAFGALVPIRLRHTEAVTDARWRVSPFPSNAATDSLTRFRSAAAGRNVIVIALESTGERYLGLYGADRDPMPNLTALASQSIVFERAYAVYPESIKGLLTVLCSRYPAFQTPADDYAGVPCRSLPAILADAGYRTALFHSGRFMYLGMEAIVKNRGFQTLEDAGAIGGNFNSSFGVDEPAAVDRILKWIDALPTDQRFFITYLPVAGHHPYATPERGPFPEQTEFGNYLNALHYGDQSLGELMEGLQERGLDRKTLFVIFGDHGEAFAQHESNFGHSQFIYEENVRVPFIVSAPGLIFTQIRVRQTASLIDTEPTVLDLLGMPIPTNLQGFSLLEGQNHIALFFTDYSLGLLGLVDGCWKYILEVDSQRSKLYNLCRDRNETDDRSLDEVGRVEAYQKIVQGWITAQALPRK